MSDELTPIYVLEESRDDPSNGPTATPDKYGVETPGHSSGVMWVWWRTGPHPQGVWQVMDTRDPAFMPAYRANEALHKPMQDQALGSPGDWGHVVCHACREMSEGYPEPRHKTTCDGVCKTPGCDYHSEEATRKREAEFVLYLKADEFDRLLKELDEPAKVIPGLKALMEKQTVFKQKEEER